MKIDSAVFVTPSAAQESPSASRTSASVEVADGMDRRPPPLIPNITSAHAYALAQPSSSESSSAAATKAVQDAILKSQIDPKDVLTAVHNEKGVLMVALDKTGAAKVYEGAPGEPLALRANLPAEIFRGWPFVSVGSPSVGGILEAKTETVSTLGGPVSVFKPFMYRGAPAEWVSGVETRYSERMNKPVADDDNQEMLHRLNRP